MWGSCGSWSRSTIHRCSSTWCSEMRWRGSTCSILATRSLASDDTESQLSPIRVMLPSPIRAKMSDGVSDGPFANGVCLQCTISITKLTSTFTYTLVCISIGIGIIIIIMTTTTTTFLTIGIKDIKGFMKEKLYISNCRSDHHSGESSRTNESWSRTLLNRCNKTEMRLNKKTVSRSSPERWIILWTKTVRKSEANLLMGQASRPQSAEKDSLLVRSYICPSFWMLPP